MGTARPKYPLAFKRSAVREAQRGDRTQQEVAHDLDISDRQLRRWLRQAEQEDEEGLNPQEMQRRINELEREIEVMREANRFFAQRRRRQQRMTSS